MSILNVIETLTEQVYGKASAVSVDQEGRGWVVRCWDAKGMEKDRTPVPERKSAALATMKRRLQRASFLRLDASDMGLSDG